MQCLLTHLPPIDQGIHINVPTVFAARLPEMAPLFGTIFAVLFHRRTLKNPTFAQGLEARYRRARDEWRKREETRLDLEEQIRLAARASKKTRKRLETQLEKHSARALERGMTVRILCAPQGQEHEQATHFTLNMGHILGLLTLPSDPFSVLCIEVRHGKLTMELQLDGALTQELASLDPIQSLPHVFRGLPQTYAALYGLAYEHQVHHGLEPGTLYYAQRRSDGALRAPSLLLESCGLGKREPKAARTARLQIELLKRITISGEYGGRLFDKVPLLEQHEEDERWCEAQQLPERVRAGQWATLFIPSALWAMQGGKGAKFAQIPVCLLRSRHLYAVNLGLLLTAERAYQGTNGDPSQGLAMELQRLLDQAGLRQPFRSDLSRERLLFAELLAELEQLGFITGLTNEDRERLLSEEIPSRQLELNLTGEDTESCVADEEMGEGIDQEPHVRVTPSRRPSSRRRYRSALKCRVVHFHLYERVLRSPPDDKAPSERVNRPPS